MPTPRLPDIQIDPGCRGDICRAVQPVASEADRTIRNVARELSKSPEAIRECLGNVPRCANEILSAPIAMLAQAYIDNLYRQAENNVFPFSEEFINLAQPYYEVDLRGVTYSDNINTGHGMTVAYCDRIFFNHSGNLWNNKNELNLVLHEIEHLVQCQKRGRRTFLAEYILKGAVDIAKNGRFNIHDIHDFEVSAAAKANNLTDILWNKIQNREVPMPAGVQVSMPTDAQDPWNRSTTSPGFQSGYGMQMCGCWGFNPRPVAAEPRCASGAVRINMCPGFCQGGSNPYGYVCQ